MAMREFDSIRKKMKEVEKLVNEETISPHEVLANGNTPEEESMAEKVALAKYNRNVVRRTLRRFKKARTASDIFADFAKDAAKTTVLEMHLAYASGDRQRAAEIVLNRALGKPVDRVMSIAMQVSSKSDPELNNDITTLLAELGIQGGEGTTSTFTLGEESDAGLKQIADVCPEPRVERRAGIPRTVYTIDGEGEISDSR